MKKIKNSWQEGLVMDFAPENTSPNCLTSALNATILTYNGNENMLQNDMGNARIETAFLPEGYIPVGTCEYGDIIYVVSYNPLINKSQIGCFPSPERNISSDEVSNLNQLLSNDDFLEIKNEKPTGNLKSSSVKKIIYDKKLLPGDKYFIYQKGGKEESFKNFSDYGGKELNSLPKYLKAHVISILDDGKIELLDSSVKWYDKYFIPTIQVEPNKTPDLDSYRDALSSGYSIFASKISGKLALLVELEKITGFNCTYSVIEDPILTTEEPPNPLYKIYWNINWSTNNNDINPKYIVLTKSNSTEDNIPKAYPDEGYYYKEINLGMPEKYSSDIDYTYYNYNSSLNLQCYLPTFAIQFPNKPTRYFYRTIKNFQKIKSKRDNLNLPVESYYYLDPAFTEIQENEIIYKNNNGDVLDPLYVNDIIVNNYFKSPIYKEFADFPKGDYIYEYEITPAMPYGLLKEYAVQGSIDFSKIGTDFVLLHTWKYYNTEDYITLTLGLDAYTSENKAIAGIDLKFYDAYGLTAVYTISNKESYSGTFTEYIPLNGINPSYKLTNKNNNNLILHKGNSLNDLKITELQEGYLYETDGNLYLIQYHKDAYYYYINNDGEEVSLLVLEDNILQNSYINDSGILYPNILYGVEIVIKNYPLDALGQFDTTTEDFFKRDYRWMWTNQMLNSQYKYLKDFKDAVGDLTLDLDVFYQTTDQWFKNEYSIEYPLETVDTSSELYKNLSANVLEVIGTNNIKGDLIIKLKDNFNTFKLNAGTTDNCILSKKTQLLVLEGKSHIEDIPGTVIQTNDSKFDIFEGIYPENNITPIIAINSKITSPYFEKCAFNPIYLKNAGYNQVEITNTVTNALNYITLTGPISVCINIDNIELIEKIEISLSSVNKILKSQNELSSEKFLINLASFHNNNSFPYPYTIYKNNLSHIENNKYRLFYIYLPCYYTLNRVIDVGPEITHLTESLIEIKNCKVHFKPGENIETPLEILPETPDQPTVKVSTNNDSTGSEIEFINNQSSEISLLKQFTKPSVNLNTTEWRQYKNNYILEIEGSSIQPGVNLNYITCNNQEDNLTDPVGLNLTNSMSNYLENKPISINYSFNGIHYSKFYKEASPSTKQVQKLVPLLNTSTDLAKYNLRINKGHLYFYLFVEMGVGYGDHSHRVINLATSSGSIVGNTTQRHYWSNGGNNKIGITKYTNSHEYWSLWKSKIGFDTGDTVYLKDIISGIVPILIGRQNDSDGHMMDITESYSRHVNIPASANAISLPENYEIATITASTDGYRFNNNNLTKLCLCSFLMKDINGDLHALNNIFPLNVDNNNEIQQTIYSQGNTIGNVIASALSNMYIVSNLYDNLLSNKLTNLIHLRNLQSKFSKDLIYKFSINKNVDYKDLVLICGVSLNDYINSILQKLQALDKKLVLIGINDIIKNIPILFNFDYIEPEKSYDFNTTLYISIRKSTDDVISSKSINYNLDLNTIYFIDTDDSIKKLESYIPFYEIDSVSTTELGEIKYQYKNTLLKHFEMEYFTYKDGMLTLVKTNYPNEQLYQISPLGRNEAISGIVKNEYLTTIGKYV